MNKTLLTTLACLGAASALQAASYTVHITGATAMRKEAYNAVAAMYSSYTVNPADALNAQPNTCTFSGTMGSDTVTVRFAMSGSIQGITDLAAPNQKTFLATGTPGDATTVSHVPELAFSDVFQATAGIAGALVDDKVGVIPFVWIKGKNSSASVTNITTQLAQSFLANGALEERYFTGDHVGGNAFNPVFLIGRDSGSGTRATAHADTFYGVGTTTTLFADDDGVAPFVPTVSLGYSSGKSVATVLKMDLSGTGMSTVGYLGMGDAKSVQAIGGDQYLAYNGVPYSADNVRNGLYTFWGYEHLFHRGDAAAEIVNFKANFGAAIDNYLANAGGPGIPSDLALTVSSMKVARNGDGGNLF